MNVVWHGIRGDFYFTHWMKVVVSPVRKCGEIRVIHIGEGREDIIIWPQSRSVV